ncbi:MAG TPA: cupin domain-containing protein [Anaerohalosphaeraceae bacterium]|jgi:quercetin dioxygenase-like cupin family protein|nr:cupin domain-containing protein [Anaerohalosphaeraceae bacterium]HRT50969.1 cupin domain-containing protein [Anaerohalosphaeraceae bacterium]HRT86955.1 cupin domain-containing protein [Anaerohalosphaeraceae bacterium]
MLIKTVDSIEPIPVCIEGAKDVSVRVIFGPADNAPTFAMRVFELAPGGHTPFHTHPFEHEAVVLSGRVGLVTPEGTKPLDVGDMLLVMPNEKHQFKNLSDEDSARFMCLVPIEHQK